PPGSARSAGSALAVPARQTPVADHLRRRLELPGQALRLPPTAHQLHYAPPKLRRVGRSRLAAIPVTLRHRGLLAPKGSRVTETGSSPDPPGAIGQEEPFDASIQLSRKPPLAARLGVRARSHTIFICCRSSLAKMLFGISAWTPCTMSTTCVTRKLTAMLHKAYASSSVIFAC